ncbi:SIR2 family protein [Lactobacillus xylocopicola]|uniref:SIR2-like domain-containing protein n=1 Tax=Lactobacillus xylocopicola TaxID=2976676 RepID=A0ABM8BI35_9LACO|nr:SIR2 family protein [Lactobacillus xylocopicola]BDR60957.1 hypothetical protein KIM322_12180 [Lactobacillus xylocopicola]
MSDERENPKNNMLLKKIRRLAITKQLSFLIGSGVSSPAIPLMKEIEEEDIDERNQKLTEKVKKVSRELLEENLNTDSEKVLKDYKNFVITLIDILNLSNSRQSPRTINLFTTNYDLFFEKAADEALLEYKFVFNDGASGYFERKLDSSNYNKTVSYRGLNDNYTNEIPSLTLIKPHGSVNWEKDSNNEDSILIRNNVVERPVTVMPTGNEEEETFENNHFHEMLRVFQLELDKPQSVLFVIGFSFQDKHIKKMIRRAMQNPELIIYVFGHEEGDKDTYMKNLGISTEPSNFVILTPCMFNKEYKQINTNKKMGSFTLSNLTDLLGKTSLEDLKDEK